MGNSSGVILPRAILGQIGLGNGAVMKVSVEGERVVLTRSAAIPARAGLKMPPQSLRRATCKRKSGLPAQSRLTQPKLVRRGEVWLAALDPTVGAEIQKTRPCLIVSPDELNKVLATLIVAPLTTGSHPARFRVPVRFRGRDGLILPDQIRTIARQR
jgi:mRNA interferase MazF